MTLLVGGAGVALAPAADAAPADQTPVTLYVDGSNGTASSGCTSPGAGACRTVGEGIAAAEGLSDSAVTVEVAAGQYDETETVAEPSDDTLTIQGAGASSTVLNAGREGRVFLVSSGTVAIDGLTITGGGITGTTGGNGSPGADEPIGTTKGAGSGGSAGGESDGGGVYNAAGANLTLDHDSITNNTATGGTGGTGGNGGNCPGGCPVNGYDGPLYGGGTGGAGGTGGSAVGGGVYNASGASLVLDDDTISGNTATGGTGGTSGNGGSGDPASYGRIEGHDGYGGVGGSGIGGGVYNASGANLALYGDTISSNTAAGGGGGPNGDFGYQGAGGQGGAAYGGGIDDAGANVNIGAAVVSSNSATGGVGGVDRSGDQAYAGSGGDAHGGGIFVASNVTVASDVLSYNAATGGAGGTVASGTGASQVTEGSTGSGGSGFGGGLDNYTDNTTATIVNDTISGNTAAGGTSPPGDEAHEIFGGVDGAGDGGGVDNVGDGATVALTDVTLSGNSADTGGGVNNDNGDSATSTATATLINDTLSSNTGTYGGGVSNGSNIVNGGGSTLTLTADTFSDDTAGYGGAIYNETGNDYNDSTATLSDSILDGSTCSGGPRASSAAITDGGYNVESDDSCGLGDTDVVNSGDIDLSPLATNGSSGPETEAIGPGSSAYEEVPASACTFPSDERGLPRPGEIPACDAGAFEYQAPGTPMSISTPSNITIKATGPNGATVNYPLPTVTDPDSAIPPTPTCTPASGTTFAVGTTTVDCSASDPNAPNSPVTTSFTVNVTSSPLTISTPPNITTPATGPGGATVTYPLPTVTDSDSATAPTPTCTPASGTTFGIRTTTVHCSAADPKVPHSRVTSSFKITVQGAGSQLGALRKAVYGVGPDRVLVNTVAAAQSFYTAGNIRKACRMITAFQGELPLITPKYITKAEARALAADARRIKSVMSC